MEGWMDGWKLQGERQGRCGIFGRDSLTIFIHSKYLFIGMCNVGIGGEG
jgi:hypothetical protein